jgi:chemotaxis protein methyltransferase CheR
MTTLAHTDFTRIAELAQRRWGLCLTERKMPLVSNRLASFLRGSSFQSVSEYMDHLESQATEEDMLIFFDILSTNVTSFFRDRSHFDYLEREFYTGLQRGTIMTPGRRIRIWSAGCSTGPEPYSLAMHAIDNLPDLERWDLKILGTDLSNYAVREAKAATYERKMLQDLPEDLQRRHFVSAADANSVSVAPAVRRLVTIARLNLMEGWPFRGSFDVIFCRNVMIYFDAPTRQRLVMRFHQILRPGGILCVGSAETLSGLDTPFQSVQASTYRK